MKIDASSELLRWQRVAKCLPINFDIAELQDEKRSRSTNNKSNGMSGQFQSLINLDSRLFNHELNIVPDTICILTSLALWRFNFIVSVSRVESRKVIYRVRVYDKAIRFQVDFNAKEGENFMSQISSTLTQPSNQSHFPQFPITPWTKH